MQQLADMLSAKLATLFPNNFTQVKFSGGIMDSIDLIFAVEPKDQWFNGYIQNATSLTLGVGGVTGTKTYVQKEAEATSYRVEMDGLERKFKAMGIKTMPAMTGTLDKIGDKVVAWFTANQQLLITTKTKS